MCKDHGLKGPTFKTQEDSKICLIETDSTRYKFHAEKVVVDETSTYSFLFFFYNGLSILRTFQYMSKHINIASKHLFISSISIQYMYLNKLDPG